MTGSRVGAACSVCGDSFDSDATLAVHERFYARQEALDGRDLGHAARVAARKAKGPGLCV